MTTPLLNNTLDCLDALPPPPAVVTRLLGCFGRKDLSLSEVEAIVREDPLLAARILRAANSAAYGTRGPARSIGDALLRLGLDEVRRLALALGLSAALPVDRHRQEYRGFWPHSLGVATLATAMAHKAWRPAGGADPDEVFLAGLFHDIGQLVLVHRYPTGLDSVRQFTQARRIRQFEAEQELLGIDHGELGARVTQHWSMPEFVVEATRFHHRPRAAGEAMRWHVALVATADLLYSTQGLGDLGETHPAALDVAAWEPLGLEQLGLTLADTLELSCGVVEEAARCSVLLAA